MNNIDEVNGTYADKRIRTCANCKHYYNDQSFPSGVPCADCRRLSHWESEVSEAQKRMDVVTKRLLDRGDKGTTLPEDVINHPSHYTSHPSGVECIEIVECMPFNIGAAMKYQWRVGLKDSNKEIEDLNKAIWFLKRQIFKREKEIANERTCKDNGGSVNAEKGNDNEGC